MSQSVPSVYVGKKPIPVLDVQKVISILERVASGELITRITKEEGMPSYHTFNKWVLMYPEVFQAYQAARQLSAQAFEDEALEYGRDLRETPGSTQRVRATEVAMNQLRWSASRRDPKMYGDKSNVNIVVPVNIETSLPMGGDKAGQGAGTEEHPNIYALEARMPDPEQVVEMEETQPDVFAIPDRPVSPLIPPRKAGRPPKPRLVPPDPEKAILGARRRLAAREKLNANNRLKRQQEKERRDARKQTLSEREHRGLHEAPEGEGQETRPWLNGGGEGGEEA